MTAADSVGLNDDAGSNIYAVQNYQQAVAQMLKKEKFEQLDCLAGRVRSGKEKFAGGMWKLHALYQGVSRPVPSPLHPTQEDWRVLLQRLEKWRSQLPKSVTAYVALAHAYLSYAWDARGGGYAETVSNSGWKLFEERTAKAAEVLDKAARLPEKCPEWYVAMQGVAQNQSWSVTDARALYAQAARFEPGYYYNARLMAQYLLPKWSGEPGDTEKFAQEVADRVGGDQGDILYFQVATTTLCNCGNDPQLSWRRIVKGFEAAEKRYGVSMLNLNLIAYLAANYGELDPVVADKAFNRIGEQWDQETWHTKDRFESTKKWAASSAPGVAKQDAMETAAESNMQTPEGLRYKAAFEEKYREVVQTCVQSEGSIPAKFETLTKVGANGTVEEMRIYWNGPTAICVYEKLRAFQQAKATPFPAPPQAPYWVRLDLNGAEIPPAGLASSFAAAAARGDAQETDATTKGYFSGTLLPYFGQKYASVLQSCFTAVSAPSKESFSFVAAIGAEGRLVHLYYDHETNILQCIQPTLQADVFPVPPVIPYYLHIDMKFSGEGPSDHGNNTPPVLQSNK